MLSGNFDDQLRYLPLAIKLVAPESNDPSGLRGDEIPCKPFLLFCCLLVLGQVQRLKAASSILRALSSMKLAGNVKEKKKLMVVLKKSGRTIQAKLLSGVAALL